MAHTSYMSFRLHRFLDFTRKKKAKYPQKKVTQTLSVVSVTNMRSALVPLHRQEFPPNLDDRAGEQCSLRQGLLQEQLESRGRPRVGLAPCGGRE